MANDRLQQKLVEYVEDAHAMEQNVSTMLTSMISTTDDPEIKNMLEHHKQRRPRSTSGGCVSAWTRWGQEPPRASRPRP